MVRIAINGCGRIGRATFMQAVDNNDITVVGLNDPNLDSRKLAYLLNHDSVYGRYPGRISYDIDRGVVKINGEKYKVWQEENPEDLAWSTKWDVEVVIESSGAFRSLEGAQKHLKSGACKVLISAPPKGDGKEKIPQIVWKVNEKAYDRDKHHILSAASCTTNSLAPLVKILHDHLGIAKGLMTTIHAYTSSQNLVDGPTEKWENMSRGRAAAENIVPTTTGAASAVTKVFPELEGRLDGMALRVPVPCGSATDFVAEVESKATEQEVNKLFKDYASGPMQGVLGVTDDPITSRDVLKDTRSSLVDLGFTKVIRKSLVKVITFYDNEWAYAARLLDLAKFLSTSR